MTANAKLLHNPNMNSERQNLPHFDVNDDFHFVHAWTWSTNEMIHVHDIDDLYNQITRLHSRPTIKEMEGLSID